jgi:hypothetical protein
MSQNIENNIIRNVNTNNEELQINISNNMSTTIFNAESPVIAQTMLKDTSMEPLKLTLHKKKCFTCFKKITIVNTMTCKCDHSFCFGCRLPEVHNCTYDHKSDGINILRKANIKIVADKINKI